MDRREFLKRSAGAVGGLAVPSHLLVAPAVTVAAPAAAATAATTVTALANLESFTRVTTFAREFASLRYNRGPAVFGYVLALIDANIDKSHKHSSHAWPGLQSNLERDYLRRICSPECREELLTELRTLCQSLDQKEQERFAFVSDFPNFSEPFKKRKNFLFPFKDCKDPLEYFEREQHLKWDGESSLDEWITRQTPAGGEPRFWVYDGVIGFVELKGATSAELVGDFIKCWDFGMPSGDLLDGPQRTAQFWQKEAPQRLKSFADRYVDWCLKVRMGDVESVASDPLFETLRELRQMELRQIPFSEERCEALLCEAEKYNVPRDEVLRHYGIFWRQQSARVWVEIDNYIVSSRSMVVPSWLLNLEDEIPPVSAADEKDPHVKAMKAQYAQRMESLIAEARDYRDFLGKEYGRLYPSFDFVQVWRGGSTWRRGEELIYQRETSAEEKKWWRDNFGEEEGQSLSADEVATLLSKLLPDSCEL